MSLPVFTSYDSVSSSTNLKAGDGDYYPFLEIGKAQEECGDIFQNRWLFSGWAGMETKNAECVTLPPGVGGVRGDVGRWE